MAVSDKHVFRALAALASLKDEVGEHAELGKKVDALAGDLKTLAAKDGGEENGPDKGTAGESFAKAAVVTREKFKQNAAEDAKS